MAGCRKGNVSPHLHKYNKNKYQTHARALPPSKGLTYAFEAFVIKRFLSSS